MFGLFAKSEPSKLEAPIDRVLQEMQENGPDTEEYPAMLSYLERLTKLKNEPRSERVSRDTLAVVVGNLAGILIIVMYEQKHVMVSKALSFIKKD